MKKRIISILLTMSMLFSMIPALVTDVGAFDIDTLDEKSYLYYIAADMARLFEDQNIFSAHYYSVGSEDKTSAEERLRTRSTSMLYQNFVELEEDNTKRAVFKDVWAILNVDTDKFYGLEERDFYAGILWDMLVGDFNATAYSIESQMEDYNSVADGILREFAEWYCVEVVKEDTTKKAEEILEKWDLKDQATIEQVVISYQDHYTTVTEAVEDEKKLFKNVGEVADVCGKVMKVCDTAIEFLTKMSQIQTIYEMASEGYLNFLYELKNGAFNTHFEYAVTQLIDLMNSETFDDALKAYLIDLACQDVSEIVLDKLSDVIKDVADDVISNAVGTIGASVFAGLKIGMEAADLILNVEDKLTVRYNMFLLDSMTDAIFDASARLRDKYQAKLKPAFDTYLSNGKLDVELQNHATAYVASIEMCYRFLLQTDMYAKQYIDVQYTAWWDGFWGDNIEKFEIYSENLKEEIEGLQSSYSNVNEWSKEQYEAFREKLVNDIIYVADDATNVPAAQTKEFCVDITLSNETPIKEGYVFEYWVDAENSKTYKVGETFTKNYSEDITLTASWTDEETITYKATNATNIPAAHVNTAGATTLSSVVPKKTGYDFLGWSEDANATVASYKAGGTLPEDKEGDITLYAVWSPKTFNVIFDANGGKFDENGTTQISKPKQYNQPFDIDVTQPYGKDGYKFAGKWDLDVDGTGDYDHNTNVSDIGGADANDKILYAVWTDAEYDVLYDYNDGSTPPPSVKVEITDPTTIYTIAEPAYGEADFKGWMFQDPYGPYWWTNGEWDNGKYSLIYPQNTIELTGDFVLYAKWDYYVHYNCGTAWSHEVVRDGSDYAIDAPAYSNGELTFKYWEYTGANGNVTYYNVGDVLDLTSDMTLTAVWVNSDGEEVKNPEGSETPDPTIPQTYTVTYDYYNGSGTTVTQQKTADVSLTLKADAPTYDGYTFLGWATSANATAAEYQSGDIYSTNADLYLYAVWEEAVVERNIIAEGTCGDTLTWALDDEGLLTVDGTGAMTNYSSIQSTPWYAYKEQITDVIIGNGVTSVGAYAFYDYNVLRTIKISDTVTSIGHRAFQNCSVLKSVTIPDTVTTIDSRAFYQCDLLEEVDLGTGVKTINDYAFNTCPKLTTITISDALTTVYSSNSSNGSFYGSPISIVNVPSTVTSIPENLYNHSSITAFVCEESEYVGGNGYFDDDGILYKKNIYTEAQTLVKCPNSKAVKSYTVLDGTTSVGEKAFQNKTTLTSLVIPGSVTSIGDSAFDGCTYLGSITLNEGLTTIGQYAFRNCSVLKSVNIPSTVSTINGYAFYNCSLLNAVYCYGNAPTLNNYSYVFRNTASDFTIYYIEGTTGWSNPWNGYTTATFVPEDTTVAVTGVKLSSSSVTLSVGDTHTLTATISPTDATNQTVTWTSSDKNVATVANGKVTAVSAGTTVISVKTDDGGYTATCTVTVESKQEISEDSPVIKLSDVHGNLGGTITVPVVMSNNPGFTSMTLYVEYDESVFTLIDVTDTDLISGAMHTEKYSSPYILTWDNDTAKENITANGTIVNLVFTIAEDAELGDYSIKLSYPQDGILDADVESVDFFTQNCTVTISNVVIGDVTGDGVLTNRDRVILARYLAGWEGYDESMINKTAADVNCDGVLTNKDRVYLARHLAGWEGYETLPIT